MLHDTKAFSEAMRLFLLLVQLSAITVSQQPLSNAAKVPRGPSPNSELCPANLAILVGHRSNSACKPVDTRYCFRNNCRRCCHFHNTCNPNPAVLVHRERCKEVLCAPVHCMYPGEYCDLTKDNTPKCHCPKSCPDLSNRVCGSDGVTYSSTCVLTKTACMLGLRIFVKFEGPCDLRTRHLFVSPLHKTSAVLEANEPGKVICSFLGKPISITWSKLEMDSLPPRMLPMKETLIIPKVGIADEGVYRCEAYDGSSVAEAFVNVTVNYDEEEMGRLDFSKKSKASCLLPRRYGYCSQHEVRWYFDVQARTCHPFVFSGCGKNENNFKTLRQCQAACGHWAGDVCKLSKRPGPCKAHIPKWFYDKRTNKCKRFIYGGCRGNANRFSSKMSCEVQCTAQSAYVSPCVRLYMDAVKSHRRDVFTPRCTADGRFQRTQCHDSVCFCMDENGAELFGTRIPAGQKINCTVNGAHQCVSQRKNTKNGEFTGKHVPRCKQDGAYENVQCTPLTGHCWCVDDNGQEMAGTRTRALLKCPTLDAQLTQCQRQYIENSKNPRPGRFVTQCAADGSYRAVQCRGINSTCSCVNRETGEEQRGTGIRVSLGTPQCQTAEGLTICQRMHQQATKHPEMSQYVPQCNEDGRFEHVQCDPDSRACWCVDKYGMVMAGTKVQGNILCPDIDAKLTSCQRRYQHTAKRLSNKINHHAPRCRADGSYEQIQCHGRTCHCVNENGVEIGHTRVKSVGRLPSCTQPETNVSPCEKARHVAMATGRFVPRCQPDGSWPTIQCEHTTQECWCLDKDGKEIKDSKTTGPLTCNNHGKCWEEYVKALRSPRRSRRLPWCQADGSYNLMQCHGSFCYCVMKNGVEVPGSKLSVVIGKPNCYSKGESLTRCQRQYHGAMLSGFMGGHVPRCKLDGRYEEVQCQAGASVCWCVDGQGNELPGTRRTKAIRCPVVGGILSHCQRQYLQYARKPSDDLMKPRCMTGGQFGSVQCQKMFCFCVDEDGNEIPGTRLRNIVGKPVCNRKAKQYLSQCQKEVYEAQMIPLAKARYEPRCKEDGSYEEIQCNTTTDECWCIDQQGHEIHGTRSVGYMRCPSAGHALTPCQKAYQDVLRRALLPQDTPQCTAEGRYEPTQCRASYCYCVNTFGVEIAYSRITRSEERPNCQPMDLGPTLCQKQLQMFMRSDDHRQLEPSCDPDGSFSDIQCYGAQCYCVDERGVEVQDTRKNFIDGKPSCEKHYFSLTQCQQHVQEFILSTGNASHHFVPRCRENGDYEQVQCDHTTGDCWCVERDGREIENTRTKGTIQCGLIDMSTPCWKDYILISKTSLPGSFIPWCTTAGTYQSTQTQGSRFFCVSERGIEALGTSVSVMMEKPNCKSAVSPGFIPSPCQRERIRKIYAPKKASSYVPKCKTDGSYDELQCDLASGQCWCVDRDGQELDRMRTAGLIICPSEAPLTRCQVQREKALRVMSLGSALPLFVPRCRVSGGFHGVQCHGLTGQCWCVDINGNEIPGSATRVRKPDCAAAAKTSTCHRHRLVAMGITGRPSPGRYVPQCKHGGEYKDVQCHGSTGLCWCVNEQGQEIMGTRIWGHPNCQKMGSGNEFPLDIAIMYPPSSSHMALVAMKNFTKSLVSAFDVTPSGTHFSLVVYADVVYSPLTFSTLTEGDLNQKNIYKIIDQMKISGSVTRLDKGLQYVDQEIFTAYNGMRALVPKVVMVIMDREQTRDQGRYIPLSIASEDLKAKGVQIYCTGIENKVAIPELMDVSSRPGNVFTVNDYDALGQDAPQIVAFVKNDTRNSLRVEKQCNLAFEPGRRGCLASILAWYYNSLLGQCLQFVYSGCSGNANNFATHENCRKTCGGMLPLCQEVQRKRTAVAIGYYRPACQQRTGKYQPVQCYMSSGYCWCADSRGKEKPQTLVRGIPLCNIRAEATSPCIEARRKALGQSGVPSIGRHVPDCDANGNYHVIQSDGNSDYYWCVNASGYAQPRTQQWGRPSCTHIEHCPIAGNCDTSPQCFHDYECKFGFKCCSCGDIKRCVPFGTTRADRRECELEQDIATSGLLEYGRNQFKPECTSDGKYKEAQCYNKICWCVDSHGNERTGTRQLGRPNCKQVASSTPCQKEYRRSMVLRSVTALSYFLSQCESNGDFKQIQCHAATGYCWCVDRSGNELDGTRQWGKPDCKKRNGRKNQTVCQYRHEECLENTLPSHFIPNCSETGAYQPVQCLPSMGECWCVDHYGYELPRTRTSSTHQPNCSLLAWLSSCQIQRRQALGRDGIPVVGLFVPECRADGSYETLQCHRDHVTHIKICWCVNQQGIEVHGSRRKPGIRPVCGKKTLCEKTRKDSVNSTGHRIRFAPSCLEDGRFSPVQCVSLSIVIGLCWCVDEYGNEIHKTMRSKKNISCTGVSGLSKCQYHHNKAVDERSQVITQCNVDGSYASLLCDQYTRQCWCVDRYHREIPGTRRVGTTNCSNREDTEICKLPVVRGPCELSLTYWFFNSTSNTCSTFLYGGCVGNQNKFPDYQQCQKRCNGKPLTACQQTKAQARIDPSNHVPGCKADGSYEPIQCHHVTKDCWCVDVSGKEIIGYKTTNSTTPVCPNVNGKVTEIQGLM